MRSLLNSLVAGQASRLDGGFTLLESVSAMMISGIGLVSAFGLTMFLFHAGSWSDRIQLATFAGESLFEELQGVPYDALQSGSDSFHGYLRQWTVTSNDHYQIIDVVVSWDGTERGLRRISLQSLISDPDTQGFQIE